MIGVTRTVEVLGSNDACNFEFCKDCFQGISADDPPSVISQFFVEGVQIANQL